MSELTSEDAFPTGGGETGAIVRELDWSSSPLGAPAAWPRSLRTAVSLGLMSPLPMAVCWGPACATIYNDAWRAALGVTDTRTMGRPFFDVWREIAGVVGPLFDQVFATGQPSRSPDLMLPVARNGGLQEAWFTISIDAIRGESGRPDGVLVALTETTDRVLAERRLLLVRRLAEASDSARELAGGWEILESILGEHRDDVPFAMLYVVDEGRNGARLAAASGVGLGHPAAPERADRLDSFWPLHRALAGSGPVVVDDLVPFGELPGGRWPESPTSAVLLPISRPGRAEPDGVLVAGVNPRRPLDAAHLDFFQLMARQIGLFAHAVRDDDPPPFAPGETAFSFGTEGRLAATSRELRRRMLELETLLDVLPVGIGIATDRECREIRVNRAFRQMLGLAAGSNASKTAPPDERPASFRVMTLDGLEVPDAELPMQVAARDAVEVKDLELNLVRDDGRVLRLLEYAAPLLDERGTPRGAVGAFVDVTEMQHALRDVARSEDRYRRIFDTAGVSIWEEDASAVKNALDGLRASGVDDVEGYLLTHPEFVGECMSRIRILDVNQATLRMFAAADKSELLESLEKGFLPETRMVFANALLAMARGERQFEAEAPMRTLDGRRIHTLLSITFPPDGDLFDSVLVSLSDITERKVAETALQQEVAIRATLARVGASLAGELNTDRLVQSVTDAATTLTGAEFGAFFYNVDEQDGESFQVYALSGVSRDAFAHFPEPRATALFGPTIRGESTIRLDDVTKDPRYGQSSPFQGMPPGHLPVRSYLAVPVVGSAGQVIGGLFFAHSEIGVFTALHEQLAAGVAAWAAIALDNARLYRDVEQANRLKDEFLATLSHELRTPLNAVLGWAHMLRKGTMKASMQARALESLERNARAQAQLVEDLLDVSRIMSGKLHIKSDTVDLRTVIANAVDTVRAGAYAKRLALEVLLPPEQTIVTGDADRLQQIVWNLVSNAIKFTPSGGRIEVQLHAQDFRAEIVVRDTGQGIDPSFQSQLFQRFRQGDASTARRHGGLGIGLSIVRHLTEAHGGTVVAESAGEGQGATFRVGLPLHALRPQEDDADAAGTEVPEGTLEGYRLLVVDDEADARELVRYVLESRGAHVVTATSAGEALHLVSSQPFDVLIADIGMPGQDGYELVRVLRTLPGGELRSMPAIAVTAYAGALEREQALEAGYDFHLAKPVEPDLLVDAVAASAKRRDADAAPRRQDSSPRKGRRTKPPRSSK